MKDAATTFATGKAIYILGDSSLNKAARRTQLQDVLANLSKHRSDESNLDQILQATIAKHMKA